MIHTGFLRKMGSQYTSEKEVVTYNIRLNDQKIPANEFIGSNLILKHTGTKKCISCGRNIKKTFQQGYCFPCTQKLAECDICLVKPELCHYDEGTCRSDDFAQAHCFIPQVIYLAVSSGLKVGITRAHQKITRWIDQGASYAMVLAEVPDRKTGGDLEVHIAEFVNDKTNWRKMLSGEVPEVDLVQEKEIIVNSIDDAFHEFIVEDEEIIRIQYPVEKYPTKIKSYNLDKTPEVQDRLMGIKGQYLIFENGVINLRKYQGYEMEIEA